MTFKKLSVNNYKDIKEYFNFYNYDLCVYSPSAIIVWSNYVSNPFYHIEDEILFISNKFTKDSSDTHLIFPLSQNKQITPGFLYDSAVKYGFNQYWFIPESYVAENSSLENYFIIKEQKDYEDYIYRSIDLASLKGKKYSKKRNLINQFRSEFIDKKRVITEKIDDSNIDECLEFVNFWFDSKDIEVDDDFKTEKIAAEKALRNFNSLEFDTLAVRIDGKISGYTMGTGINDKTWVLHFEKASAAIKGLYQYLDRQTAREVCNRYEYINKESDMGVKGIAHSKKSYYPVKRYKSYRLIIK